MNFRQDYNALSEQDLNKILTQFKYQFLGTSPTVETQNVDVLPNDEFEITESEMILKRYSSFILPSGPTSERPTSTVEGAIRLNTDTGLFESFNGGSWTDVGGGLEFSESNYQIEGENLCTNGTFDTDVSGWTGPIEWDSTNGGRALINNGWDSSGEAEYEFEVLESGYYLFEFDISPSATAAAYFFTGNEYIEGDGKIILVDYFEAGPQGIVIGNYYQPSGQKMWIDNVQIFKVTSNIAAPNIGFSNDFNLFISPTTTYLGNSPNPGNSNLGLGFNSLFSNTSAAYNNIAIGTNSLFLNSGGDNNVAIGVSALYGNTNSLNNVAVGNYSLNKNNGGSNVAIGYKTLPSNTTGSRNSALGAYSLNDNTIGTNNTSVGYSSLYKNTTGELNTALGYTALYSNTTGSYNTSIGAFSLQSNTGSFNSSVGYYSMYSNTSGSNNTALGNNSLRYNTTGSNNTSIGYRALFFNTTGSTNTAIGYNAYENGSYSNSTAIGYAAQPTKSNQVVFGNNSIEEVKMRNYVFNVDQTLGVAQDGWVLKYNHSTGQFEAAAP